MIHNQTQSRRASDLEAARQLFDGAPLGGGQAYGKLHVVSRGDLPLRFASILGGHAGLIGVSGALIQDLVDFPLESGVDGRRIRVAAASPDTDSTLPSRQRGSPSRNPMKPGLVLDDANTVAAAAAPTDGPTADLACALASSSSEATASPATQAQEAAHD